MTKKLSILVATMDHRRDSFVSLMDSLLPQIDNSIEVLALWNRGELTIGEYRQQLLEAASGDYICFIDDDDRIPAYYVAEILANLGKDYVGFELQLFNDDQVMPKVFHSIKYGVWYQDDNGYYRGVTHLNPIKRSLALQGTFVGATNEDEGWARVVTPLVRTENYIDKIMYYYHHSSQDSMFGGTREKRPTYPRAKINSVNFQYV